jgi:hypothetical protein
MIFDKIRVRKEKKRIELVSAERLALSGLVEETQNYIDSHKWLSIMEV